VKRLKSVALRCQAEDELAHLRFSKLASSIFRFPSIASF